MVPRWLPAPLLALAIVLGACSGEGKAGRPAPAHPPETIEVPAGSPIKIGVSAALSGTQVNLGTDIADAAELAVVDLGGSVRGHAVQIERMDDGCADAERAVAVARAFIADSAVAGVIGPMCTTGAQAANSIYERQRLVHISASSTRSELSGQGEQYFFRVAWRDNAQAQVQARYARESMGAQTAIILDDGDPYGSGLAMEFVAAFEEDGGRVLSRERIAPGTTDFASLSRQVLSANPDVVVFEGFNPAGALLVKSLRETGYTGRFMAPDAMLSIRDFLQTAGNAADDAIVTGGRTPDEAFVARFASRYQRPPATPFVLQSHDAATAFVRAIEAVAEEDEDGKLVISRERLGEALRATDLAGRSGTVRFDGNGDRTGLKPEELGLAVYRVTGGSFSLVE